MPRLYEIETACRAAIVIEPNGRRTITTRRFLAELVRYDGRTEFAKLMGRALITADGEAVEGDDLDDVEVSGVVTHTIIDLQRDYLPVI